MTEDRRDKPDVDALYERAWRRLSPENASQWPVGFDEALATARKEAERAYSEELARATLGGKAEEAYLTTFARTYDRVRVRGGLG